MKTLLRISIYFLIAIILYFNIRLYHTQDYDSESGYDKDVYAQLQHLKHEMHYNRAGLRMQDIFPEGFVFQNALYGLTWCDLLNEQTSEIIKMEALAEIDWAIEEVLSENGTHYFSKNLPVRYGIYYSGWTSYLIGSRLRIQAHPIYDSIFRSNCNEISQVFDSSESPYLESYRNACWPADNMMGAATLAVGNELFDNGYASTLSRWVVKVKQRLDSDGLIPHSVDYTTGTSSQAARGNSMSLMLCFLPGIDAEFAKEQFVLYKNQFLDTRLGLPGIRENKRGNTGGGDIDSGPVIWGIGGAASIVGERTMAVHHNWEVYEGLKNSIEAFGAAYTLQGKKKYVLGVLPMADAFIAWSNSSAVQSEVDIVNNWRWKFQLGSSGLLLFFIFLLRKIWK